MDGLLIFFLATYFENLVYNMFGISCFSFFKFTVTLRFIESFHDTDVACDEEFDGLDHTKPYYR